jgi:hypothetical protein
MSETNETESLAGIATDLPASGRLYGACQRREYVRVKFWTSPIRLVSLGGGRLHPLGIALELSTTHVRITWFCWKTNPGSR